ncbi:ATP-binding protein [Actinoplanes octamycinicus]|uniref:ATP-binding protein n=1 Tax=Actinoplanes octamycinicus TaxID=135948 RepID=UPI0031ECD01A
MGLDEPPSGIREEAVAVRNLLLVAQTSRLSCTNDPEQALTSIAVRGQWDADMRTEVARVLRASVAETPRAVLVDVSDLGDPGGESASTWQTAARFAAENRIPTRVIVCAAPLRVRARLAADTVAYEVTVADSITAARGLLGPFRGWNHPHIKLRLPPEPGSVVAARTLAGEACVTYHLTHLIHPARLIVSELAGNAVEHAGTDFEVRVSVRGPLLHLAVRDGDPRLPRLIEAAPGPAWQAVLARGCGLRVVAEAAAECGSLPCPGARPCGRRSRSKGDQHHERTRWPRHSPAALGRRVHHGLLHSDAQR